MNLDALTSAELARDFDPRTWDRGARYAGEGRVRDLTVSPGAREVTMTGTVRGTRSYRVIVTLVEDRDGIGVEGDCECPVGWNCKHAVAVLLEAVEPAPALPASSVPRVPPTRTTPAALHPLRSPIPASPRLATKRLSMPVSKIRLRSTHCITAISSSTNVQQIE